MGQFLPPDHAAGDANTIGGYQAVHGRPAAFEGKDSRSYSVEIVVDMDDSGESAEPYSAYLLFVRWEHDGSVATGHLETDYLVHSTSEDAARAKLGSLVLSEVKRMLDECIDDREPPSRPWYEAMRDA